jgi:hypothetical protein
MAHRSFDFESGAVAERLALPLTREDDSRYPKHLILVAPKREVRSDGAAGLDRVYPCLLFPCASRNDTYSLMRIRTRSSWTFTSTSGPRM